MSDTLFPVAASKVAASKTSGNAAQPGAGDRTRTQGASRAERLADVVRSAPFVCGTSSLGNLYRVVDRETKLAICREWFEQLPKPLVVDTAGKYGAGMALEEIGRCLRELGAKPDDVVLSNKLAWRRTPLRTKEPTFEPGLWKGMSYDAEQAISYDGIMDCWVEGCELLGGDYRPRLVSVHDPDDFLNAASSPDDRRKRMDLLLEAYHALGDLKRRGEVDLVGVGAKDWGLIREIDKAVGLDWVMFATLYTVYRHPPEILADLQEMASRGVLIVNAGVMHSGFLAGGSYFDYAPASRSNEELRQVFEWRDRFFELCEAFGVIPAAASVRFATSPPAIATVSLNCDTPSRVSENLAAVSTEIDSGFWDALKAERLIAEDFPYLGVV